jgi:pantoate--beta-alanine ligase
MSSRNRFLSASERDQAPALIQVLRATAARRAAGADERLSDATGQLEAAGFDVDYLALVDGPTLAAIERSRPGARLIAAAKLGSVRLLDNIAAG